MQGINIYTIRTQIHKIPKNTCYIYQQTYTLQYIQRDTLHIDT